MNGETSRWQCVLQASRQLENCCQWPAQTNLFGHPESWSFWFRMAQTKHFSKQTIPLENVRTSTLASQGQQRPQDKWSRIGGKRKYLVKPFQLRVLHKSSAVNSCKMLLLSSLFRITKLNCLSHSNNPSSGHVVFCQTITFNRLLQHTNATVDKGERKKTPKPSSVLRKKRNNESSCLSENILVCGRQHRECLDWTTMRLVAASTRRCSRVSTRCATSLRGRGIVWLVQRVVKFKRKSVLQSWPGSASNNFERRFLACPTNWGKKKNNNNNLRWAPTNRLCPDKQSDDQVTLLGARTPSCNWDSIDADCCGKWKSCNQVAIPARFMPLNQQGSWSWFLFWYSSFSLFFLLSLSEFIDVAVTRQRWSSSFELRKPDAFLLWYEADSLIDRKCFLIRFLLIMDSCRLGNMCTMNSPLCESMHMCLLHDWLLEINCLLLCTEPVVRFCFGSLRQLVCWLFSFGNG